VADLDLIVANDNGKVTQTVMVHGRAELNISMKPLQALDLGHSISRAGFSAYLDQIEAKLAESRQHLEQVRERHA
jgi:hypothetical protein